jgi:hypothetical protein
MTVGGNELRMFDGLAPNPFFHSSPQALAQQDIPLPSNPEADSHRCLGDCFLDR